MIFIQYECMCGRLNCIIGPKKPILVTDLRINIQLLLHHCSFFAQKWKILKVLKQSHNMKSATFHGNHVLAIVHY